MLRRLLLLLLFLQISLAARKCPKDCVCSLDDPVGRNRVLCDKGGLDGPLDLTEVALDTEVLIISAPEDNLNNLKIGPIFADMKNLQEIHITRSNIPEIGVHSFWLLPKMELLNLRENNISTILDQSFRGLMNLETLYLDENRIERLTSGSFKYLENLRVLSLSNNRIEELVTRVFEKLGRLQKLNLNGNRIMELNPEAFMDIQDLKILQCRSCGLKTINNDFFHLIPQLQILDFGENDFKYIAPNDFSDLPNLRSLWLDVNKITAIPHKAFSNQRELRKLSLSRNRIHLIANSAFKNLSNLMDLNLGYNNLKEINSEVINDFGESLQILELSGNDIDISEFKVSLSILRRLRQLGLSEMNLSDLPLGLFDFNKDISSLSLAGNYFVFFPVGALSPVPNLKELDFSKNKLKGLDKLSLQRIESIEEVNFNGNPWVCDLCYIIPMLEKMNTSTFLQNIICKSPYYFKGKRLLEIEVDQLEKCTTEEGLVYDPVQQANLKILFIALAILSVVLPSIFIIVCLYTKRHARHYYTHEEKRNLEHDKMCESPDLPYIESSEINFKFPIDTINEISIISINGLKDNVEKPNKN